MIITTYISSIILWIAYSMLEGIRESFYYHYKVNNELIDKKEDLHTLFTLQRFIVILFIFYITNLYIAFSCACLFPFWHDGSYYFSRNALNPNIYKKTWKDSSTTSTAKIELNYKTRIILLILGITVIILQILDNL